MRRISRGLFVLGAVLAAGVAAAAEKEGSTLGVSVDASALLGLGVSVGMPVGERFNVRGVYHGFKYDIDDVENHGATYKGELELKTFGVLADWHPFKGAFRVTAGFASNGNQINLTGKPTGGQFNVGNCTYESDPTPGQGLQIDGAVEFSSSAPYLGIGWGGNLNAEPGFYGTFDLGVLFSGSPETTLDGHGRARNADQSGASDAQCGGHITYQDVSAIPQFQQEVQNAEDDVNDETDQYKLWPNIAFGLGWRF